MTTAEWNRRYGQVLRGARQAAGLTQDDVGKLLGLVRSSVANIEAGRQTVSAADAAKLHALLHAQPPDWPAPDGEVAVVVARQAAEVRRLRAVIVAALNTLSEGR